MVGLRPNGHHRAGHHVPHQSLLGWDLVRPVEEAEQSRSLGATIRLTGDEVRLGDDPDEPPVLGDRKPAHARFEHPPRCLLQGGVGADGEDVGGHQLTNTHQNLLCLL
jgi:hypothetical protein